MHGDIFLMYFIVFCAAFFQCQAQGSTITFEQTPHDVTEYLTPDLTLTCDLYDPQPPVVSSDVIGRRDVTDVTIGDVTHSLHNIDHVTSIVVARGNGPPVATISDKTSTHQPSLTAHGDLRPGALGRRGHLQVTWDSPTCTQSGDYTCTVTGTDSSGQPHTFTKTLRVDVTPAHTTQLAKAIHDLQLDNLQMHTQLDTIWSSIQALPNNSSAVCPPDQCLPLPVCPSSVPETFTQSSHTTKEGATTKEELSTSQIVSSTFKLQTKQNELTNTPPTTQSSIIDNLFPIDPDIKTTPPSTTKSQSIYSTASATLDTNTTINPQSSKCCTDLTITITDLGDQLSNLSASVGHLQSGVTQTGRDVISLTSHSHSVDSRLEGIELAIRNMNNTFNVEELTTHGLQADYESLVQMLDNFTNNSGTNQTHLCATSFMKIFERINSTLNSLLSTDHQTTGHEEYINTILNGLISQVNNTHATLMRDEINNLTLMFEEFTTASHLMKEDMDYVKNSTDLLKTHLNQITDNTSRVELDVALLKVEDTFFKDEVTSLQNTTTELHSHLAAVSQAEDYLNTEVAELRKDKDVMKDMLLNLTEAIDHLSTQHIHNGPTHPNNTSSCSQCDTSDLQTKVDSLENKVVFMEVDMQNVKTENSNLRILTNTLTYDVETLKSRNDALTLDNAMMTSQVSTLNSQIVHLNHKVNQILGNVQSTPHIEQGEGSCGDSSTQWSGREGPLWFTERTVYFSQAYTSSPHVHVGVTKYNQENKDNPFFEIQISSVSPQQFTVRCVVWQWVHVYDIGFSWISFNS